MHERIDRMKEFFASGTSVCPFARKYAERVGFSLVPDAYRSVEIEHPILDLVKSDELMVATYVFQSDMDSHGMERQRAERFFKDLYRILAKDEYGPADFPEAWTLLESMIDRIPPESDETAAMAHRGKPLFSVAMNPLYPNTHPRYAPCASFVVTRYEDVAAVPKPIQEAIRRSSFERAGREYNADKVYLTP